MEGGERLRLFVALLLPDEAITSLVHWQAAELARLQANFAQQQLAVAHAQSQDLLQLYAQLAQQTFANINSAVAKNFEQLQKID